MLLEMKKISKLYPGVTALDKVDFDLKPGEVHALLGENGAGKSTLIKILAGAEMKTKGEIFFQDKKVEINNPLDAGKLGINVIYQELNLVPFLSIAENIFLHREPILKWRFSNRKEMFQQSEIILGSLGMHINPDTMVEKLSVAEQQMVEIAKALSTQSKVIVMDEPSATLTYIELDNLFRTINILKKKNVGIIYISHRLEEFFRIADRATILRDGKKIRTLSRKKATKNKLIQLMVGRKLDRAFPLRRRGPEKEEVLRVEGLCSAGLLRNVSFSLRKGEIVGLAGLVGAGRTEVARAIIGDYAKTRGEIFLHGKIHEFKSPGHARKHGICLVSEDRKRYGLVLGLSVRDNITLANLDAISNYTFIDKSRQNEVSKKYIRELSIKTPSVQQTVNNLSGGNQQKVVLAKWLFAELEIIIFDEPTRGIDVGAKYEIYLLMNDLIRQGKTILMISSELPEIIGMSDRVLVMHKGRISGEIAGKRVTQEKIMQYAVN